MYPGIYGATMSDMYLDTYYICSASHGSEDTPKWYLREYDEKANAVVWVTDMKKAREFNTKSDATSFANSTKRGYVIEEVEDWCF